MEPWVLIVTTLGGPAITAAALLISQRMGREKKFRDEYRNKQIEVHEKLSTVIASIMQTSPPIKNVDEALAPLMEYVAYFDEAVRNSLVSVLQIVVESDAYQYPNNPTAKDQVYKEITLGVLLRMCAAVIRKLYNAK